MAYIFGVSRTKKPATMAKTYDAIARKHGGEFINTSMPDEGERSWFEVPDYGRPHNQNTANAILAEISAVTDAA